MSKHTPGEWHVFDNRDDKDFDIHDPARVGVGGEFYDIAHCSGFNCGKSGDEVLANARLIAASPLMYEALTKLIEKFYEVAERHNDRSCDYDVCEEVRLTRAAIAAAEGK